MWNECNSHPSHPDNLYQSHISTFQAHILIHPGTWIQYPDIATWDICDQLHQNGLHSRYYHRKPMSPGCKFRCHRCTGEACKNHFVALRKSRCPSCLIRRGTCKTLVLPLELLLIRQGKDKQIYRRAKERKCVSSYGMNSCFDRDDEERKKLWRPCRLWCWSLWTPNLCLKYSTKFEAFVKCLLSTWFTCVFVGQK